MTLFDVKRLSRWFRSHAMIRDPVQGDSVKKSSKGLVAIAAAAIVALAFSAHAQTTKAPEKAAEKAPAAKTTEKKVAKAKSACNAITEEAACKADATCSWIAALMDAKTGKQKRKAYCKTKPKPPAKKAKEPAKDPPKK